MSPFLARFCLKAVHFPPGCAQMLFALHSCRCAILDLFISSFCHLVNSFLDPFAWEQAICRIGSHFERSLVCPLSSSHSTLHSSSFCMWWLKWPTERNKFRWWYCGAAAGLCPSPVPRYFSITGSLGCTRWVSTQVTTQGWEDAVRDHSLGTRKA